MCTCLLLALCLTCFRRQHCNVPSSCLISKPCIVYICMCVKVNKAKLSEVTFQLTKYQSFSSWHQSGFCRPPPSSATVRHCRRRPPLSSSPARPGLGSPEKRDQNPAKRAVIGASTRLHARLQLRVSFGACSSRAAVPSSESCPSCSSSLVGTSWLHSKWWFSVLTSLCGSLCLVLPFFR